MPLSTSDLIQIAIVTFFSTIIARWANRIIDNFEGKLHRAKEVIKEKLKHV